MEIEVLAISVNKQVLTVTKSHTFVADTWNIYTASFTFDEEWEGFAKTVIFQNGNLIHFAILNEENKCTIPADVIKSGYLNIGIQGNKENQIITTKKADRINVYESGGSMNMIPEPFEQSEFDRLMDELANTRAFVSEQTETINQAVEDLNNAETGLQQAITTAGESKTALEIATGNANIAANNLENNIAAANTAQTTLSEATTTAVGTQETLETANQAAEDNLSLLEGKNGEVESLVQRVNRVAPGVVCEATGRVITLEDSAELPLQSLTIYGKSTQDGTPTPENPIEIVSVENSMVGVGDKNLISFPFFHNNGAVINGVRFTYDDKGVFAMSSKSSVVRGSDFIIDNDFDCNIGEIYYSNNNNNNNKYYTLIALYNRSNNAYVKTLMRHDEFVFTVPNDFDKTTQKIKVLIEVFSNIGDEINISGYYPFLSKVEPQTITFPYTLHGIPVNSNGNYTDADGQQWVCDTVELNADGTGKLVQRCVEITIDDTDNIYVYGSDTLQRGFYINNVFSENMYRRNGFASIFIVKTSENYESNIIWLGASNKTAYIINSSFYDESLNDKGISIFKAYLAKNPLKIVTYVTTPTETELTEAEVQAFLALHTNKPYTTIFNDQNGDMTVEYVADTKLYIDNKFTELQNAILSTGGNV